MGFLSEAQRLAMGQDVPCALRRTNVFLRFVSFLFTFITAGAAVSLFLTALSAGSSPTTGVLFLIVSALVYGVAEGVVSEKDFYRHGVEEALVVLSVVLFCIGLELTFFNHLGQSASESIVPISGAVASFLIYRRFSLHYAFLAAMIFVAFTPHYWTASHTAQHLLIAATYSAGLAITIPARRTHHFDYLDDDYSITEALLWLGIYLTVNLQISSIDQFRRWMFGMGNAGGFPKPFYWATYILIWCLPVAVLWRALRRKDRVVAIAGLIAAILTLVTNKPYLGWPHHSWDPMLLGLLLMGVAVAAKRWLAKGEGGIRHGFTAQRLSAQDLWIQNLMSASAVAASDATALAHTPNSDPTFSGGDSAGGGASSTF